MKIKLRSYDFKQYNGTIIDVDLDEAGDAPLPKHIAHETGRIHAFPDEFDIVNENVIPGGYTMEIQVRDLNQLHVILDVLPETVLASAELHKN